MNRWIIRLANITNENQIICGNKAAALARIHRTEFRVPSGFCLTSQAYTDFIRQTGVDRKIMLELGRKNFGDMRWEEIWDASLRIRNTFVRTPLPEDIRSAVLEEVESVLNEKSLVIRSSSLSEDSGGTSFAGLHESFVNIREPERILECIRLVWASLWSDGALLYRNELKLGVDSSAMAVVIQELISGDVSGVAFCTDPNDAEHAVIESVYGLNKGLVDGDVTPDRFVLDRRSGRLISSAVAEHTRIAETGSEGVRIQNVPESEYGQPSLNALRLECLFSMMRSMETLFGRPQDIEWTVRGDDLFVLQSRPITAGVDGERAWYLSLRNSVDHLMQLRKRIEQEILPQMDQEARDVSRKNPVDLSDLELADEILHRKECADRWRDVYWDECIPFAHGVRLFGSVYTDMMHPDDPYEFVEIIQPRNAAGMERNRRMLQAAERIHANPDLVGPDGCVADVDLKQILSEIAGDLSLLWPAEKDMASIQPRVMELLERMADQTDGQGETAACDAVENKAKLFIESFKPEDREYACSLMDLASASYRLRDDDNLYLGRITGNLSSAVREAQDRLCDRLPLARQCDDPAELIQALRDPAYTPRISKEKEEDPAQKKIAARQIRGQPAGRGIARSAARVIYNPEDLFDMQRGEILVCDALDPSMTFVVPLAAAIVERRGGMLIHGAIIAREYGIPCVTGIPGALEFIRTGDRLTVDGDFGLVINHNRTQTAGNPV